MSVDASLLRSRSVRFVISVTVQRKIIPYNPKLKERAKERRKNMTLAEVLLWKEIKQKNMLGYDFDRQRPIDEYIVDFYCKDLSLAIEVDGSSHNFNEQKHAIRQRRLESLGIRFLRFWDHDVKNDMQTILRSIREWIVENCDPPVAGEGKVTE